MSNKAWIFDIVLFILWTTAFIGNLITGDIHILSYIFLYIAFFCELAKNFLWHIMLRNAEIEIVYEETEITEENNNNNDS